MSAVVVGMSMSLDGVASFATSRLRPAWLRDFEATHPGPGAPDHTETRLWAEEFERFGAQVIGRRVFDQGHPCWGNEPPGAVPVFVATQRPRPRIEGPGAGVTFVTGGVLEAVDQARAAAGRRDVLIAGGLSVVQQALVLGVVDEVTLLVRPVLAGGGARLFDMIGPEDIALAPIQVSVSGTVTRLRYAVLRRPTSRGLPDLSMVESPA